MGACRNGVLPCGPVDDSTYNDLIFTNSAIVGDEVPDDSKVP